MRTQTGSFRSGGNGTFKVRKMMSYASYVVVLLSRGMLRDPSFARLVLAVATPQQSAVGMASRTASLKAQSNPARIMLS